MFGMGKDKEDSSQKNSGQDQSSDAAFAAIDEAISASKKTRKNKQNVNAETTQTGGSLSHEMAEQARKLFNPEAWKPLVNMPFRLGQLSTGRDCWALDKTEEETLATSTAMTAEYFLNTDPKWVALTLFAINWTAIVAHKMALSAKEARVEQQLKDAVEGHNHP